MKSPHFLLIKLYSHDICISIIVFLLQSCSISVSNVSSVSGGSATQGPTGTKYPPATWHFFRYPTMFSSENHQVSGNPKYQVPDILGIPDISGKPEHRVYIHTHTRNYPRLNKIPRYTWANISTLLPDPNLPATLLFFQYPDPAILKISDLLGPAWPSLHCLAKRRHLRKWLRV